MAADISRQSLDRYRQGQISALDLLTSLRREMDTSSSLLDAYSDWRQSLQTLQTLTYLDFESNQPVFERFAISISTVVPQ